MDIGTELKTCKTFTTFHAFLFENGLYFCRVCVWTPCMIAGENIVSMSPNSIKRNNIFNVMEPEDDEKILENLTDQCLVKENEKKGSDPFCSSPFSSYTLIVKQGNMTNCPQIETQENCKGLSLEGLKAIHLYLKYYIV